MIASQCIIWQFGVFFSNLYFKTISNFFWFFLLKSRKVCQYTLLIFTYDSLIVPISHWSEWPQYLVETSGFIGSPDQFLILWNSLFWSQRTQKNSQKSSMSKLRFYSKFYQWNIRLLKLAPPMTWLQITRIQIIKKAISIFLAALSSLSDPIEILAYFTTLGTS